MSENETEQQREEGGHERPKRQYTEAELAEMSRDEKMRLGLALDDVELVSYQDPWPVE